MRFPVIVAAAACLASATLCAAAPLPTPRSAPRPVFQASMDSVRSLWRGGDITGAMKIIRRLRMEHPNDPDVMFAYVQRSMAAGDSALVRDEVQHRLTAEPTSAVAAYLSGLAAASDSGRWRGFREAVARDPGFAQAHMALAQMALGRVPPDTVSALLETHTSLRLDPSSWSAWRTLGYLSLGRGDTATAAAAFRAVWTADSLLFDAQDRINAHITDARALGVRAPVAAAALLAVLPADTPDWADYNQLALLVNAGHATRAMRLIDENLAAATDPNARMQFLYAKASVLARLQQQDSAFAALDRAIDAGLRGPERLGSDQLFGNAWRQWSATPQFAKAAARLSEAPEDRRTPEERKEAALANRLDQAIPPLEFQTPKGKLVTLQSLKGKVVVLDFWATWCGPCRRTMPLLSEFTLSVDPAKVAVLSADIFERAPDGRDKAQKMFRDNNYAMDLVYAEDGYGQLLGFDSIPTLMVLAPDGRLAWRHVGYSPELPTILRLQTEALLAEAQAAR